LSPIGPAVPASPAPFVIVGMIACFGSIAHAPLAVMLMVAEMTGSLELLAPAMVAVGIATLIVGDHTIYEGQLKSRADSPANRFRFGMPLLGSVPIAEVMTAPRLTLRSDEPVERALAELRERGLKGAPVVGRDGSFVGSVAPERLAEQDGDRPLSELLDTAAPSVHAGANLDAVVEALATMGVDWVPVLDDERRVVGVVAAADLIAGQRLALREALRRFEAWPRGTTLVEVRVGQGSTFVGRRIADGGWPPGSIVVTIQRDQQLLFPEPGTTLREGDVVSLLAATSVVDRLTAELQGSEPLEPPPAAEPPAEGPGLV
ncbi:MAG TPA: CBS domain-containing protein, partial [Actinomycetota bacterium]|nr:CBS domain-containing protein [Actinomycetota bacterium]